MDLVIFKSPVPYNLQLDALSASEVVDISHEVQFIKEYSTDFTYLRYFGW